MKNTVKNSIQYIGVIGSRSLSYQKSDHVGAVVEDLLDRGFFISTGGAIGTDQFVVERLLRIGLSDHATIVSAWKHFGGFPVKVRAMVRQFKDYGGSILWGLSSAKEAGSIIKTALLQRNLRLVQAAYGICAFVTPDSRGTLFTISLALKEKLPVVVFPIDCDLPEYPNIKWRPLRCGGVWDGSFKAVYMR